MNRKATHGGARKREPYTNALEVVKKSFDVQDPWTNTREPV